MPKKLWEPGQSPYAEFLASLTPEEKAAHLRQRRERKALRRAMQEVVAEYQNRWVANLHNAAWVQLMRARDNGDTAAFIAVWDRIVGRPDFTLTTEEGRPLPWRDE